MDGLNRFNIASTSPLVQMWIKTQRCLVCMNDPSTGNKTVHRQDNSPTRFLKTVHRQIWRQFTDTFEDSSSTLFYHVNDIWLENIIYYCEEILMSYDLRWYVDIICWESDILFVWLMINGQTFDCYMKLYWCDPIANRTLFLWNSPAIQSIPFEYLNRFVQDYLFIFI